LAHSNVISASISVVLPLPVGPMMAVLAASMLA
jgi:hypothetical protein